MPNTSNQAEHKLTGSFTTAEISKLGINLRGKKLPEPKKCKYCEKMIYYEGYVFNGMLITIRDMPQRCTCDKAKAYWEQYDARQEQQKHDEEMAKKQKKFQERTEQLLGKSGIKKRFLIRTFENFKINSTNRHAYEAARMYVDEFETYNKNGRGICFEGTCGTGKTHLAVAISLELIKKGISVICKTSIDMLADIKQAYDENSLVSEKEFLSLYKDVNLLIIDDLGKEQCTEWSMPILYSILNDRYEAMKPTIITSNYNEDMLIRKLTPKGSDSSSARAIISRLRECTDVVTMAWEDYRSKL